jgi:outer membrane protein assembly factor BamB
MRHLKHSFWLLALLLGLAACSSKDKDVEKPSKLTPLAATLSVDRVWSESVVADKKQAKLRLGLGLSTDGQRVYAAAHNGNVAAIDAANGHVAWRTRTKAPLSGGTAVGDGLMLVGTSDGQLFALDAASGAVRWRVRITGEVLAPAAISPRLIALRSVEGRVHALSPADGHELWTYDQQVPRLSLRGTSRPVIAGDLLLCGFDNGRIAAVSTNDGAMVWEQTVTPPHGRTELERLDDIDSPVIVSGQDVYTVGFQGRVAMLALDTGQVWWAHEASSYRGMILDGDVLYMVTADGQVIAMRARTGTEIWRQKTLLNRGLSAPAVTDSSIIVGDYQGYVHWLDRATGELQARTQDGKTRISTAPLVVGDKVVVINDRGQMRAYRTEPIKGKAKAPKAEKPAPAS